MRNRNCIGRRRPFSASRRDPSKSLAIAAAALVARDNPCGTAPYRVAILQYASEMHCARSFVSVLIFS